MGKDAEQFNLETGVIERDSKDAQGRFIKGFSETKAVDLASRTVEGVASTIHLDRDGEVILPSAFGATMGKFLGGNAPLLAAHSHRTGDGDPTQIGWVMEMRIEREAVPCKFRFATSDAAEQWWKLASDAAGKGIAFSIGFRPIQWVYGTAAELARQFPELRKVFKEAGLADDARVRVYTQIELYEISAVPVPSNRESLQLRMAKAFEASAAGTTSLSPAEEKGWWNFGVFLGKAIAEAPEMQQHKSEIIDQLRKDLAEIRDGISELREIIMLSSDDLGQAAPQVPSDRGPLTADDTLDPGDDGKGAPSCSAARELAASLRNDIDNQN